MDVDDMIDGPASHSRAKNKKDNNPPADPEGVVKEELLSFIERLERLSEEKAGIQEDIKDVFAEVKGRGFDVKTVRKLLVIRRKDASERQEEEAILELYMQALGMI